MSPGICFPTLGIAYEGRKEGEKGEEERMNRKRGGRGRRRRERGEEEEKRKEEKRKGGGRGKREWPYCIFILDKVKSWHYERCSYWGSVLEQQGTGEMETKLSGNLTWYAAGRAHPLLT